MNKLFNNRKTSMKIIIKRTSLKRIGLRAHAGQRVALLAGVLAAAVLLYFGALWAAGLKLRQLLRR